MDHDRHHAGRGYGGAGTTAVSFDIPLKEAPGAIPLIPAPTEKAEEEGIFPTPLAGCTGNVTKPGAEKGNLCIFAREEANVSARKIYRGMGGRSFTGLP